MSGARGNADTHPAFFGWTIRPIQYVFRSGHTVFANRGSSGHVTLTNRGINVQTDTNQDQGCESAGVTSGITNACTATSGPGSTETSTETQVTLQFTSCFVPFPPTSYTCGTSSGGSVISCNNLGCSGVSCVGSFSGPSNCTTNNGIQLTSCSAIVSAVVTCTLTETHTVPGTGITQSGGVSG
jgi:hypothetical protein